MDIKINKFKGLIQSTKCFGRKNTRTGSNDILHYYLDYSKILETYCLYKLGLTLVSLFKDCINLIYFLNEGL